MPRRPLLAICALDRHIEDVEFLIQSIREVYDCTADVALATFGDGRVPPSVALREYGAKNGLSFFDAPRQNFASLDGAPVCCEVIGYLSVSKHFYDSGYDEVYLLHPDMYLFRDPLPWFRKHRWGTWSFVNLFWHLHACNLSFEGAVKMGSRRLEELSLVTLPAAFFTFSEEFVRYLFSKFFNEEGMWRSVFNEFSVIGDLCLFDVARTFVDFDPRTIDMCGKPQNGGFEQDFVMLDGGIFVTRKERMNKQSLLDKVAKNPTICLVHNRLGTALLKGLTNELCTL